MHDTALRRVIFYPLCLMSAAIHYRSLFRTGIFLANTQPCFRVVGWVLGMQKDDTPREVYAPSIELSRYCLGRSQEGFLLAMCLKTPIAESQPRPQTYVAERRGPRGRKELSRKSAYCEPPFCSPHSRIGLRLGDHHQTRSQRHLTRQAEFPPSPELTGTSINAHRPSPMPKRLRVAANSRSEGQSGLQDPLAEIVVARGS